MTKVFGILAWSAVAVIAIVGIARGQELDTLLLLCISTAIASIPVGLPTFVQAMLSSGAQRLAESKAVVKIAHRRRDPRRDDGHQQRQDRHADDERDDRHDDAGRRGLVHDRGRRLPEDRRDPRAPAAGSCPTSGGWRSG